MAYTYILTRLKETRALSIADYNWMANTINWLLPIEEIKNKLIDLYPSLQDQWKHWNNETQNSSYDYFWVQIPMGACFEFSIHFQPFHWLSIQTTYQDEVIRIAKTLDVSVLDIQSGKWIYIQKDHREFKL